MSNIAATVRKHKEAHPEMYCRVPSCLWRTTDRNGANPCQKHPVALVPGEHRKADFDDVSQRTERVIVEAPANA